MSNKAIMLTKEQIERIQQNRLAALERLKRSQAKLQPVPQLPSQSVPTQQQTALKRKEPPSNTVDFNANPFSLDGPKAVPQPKLATTTIQINPNNVQNNISYLNLNKKQKINSYGQYEYDNSSSSEDDLEIKYNQSGYRQFKEDGQWIYTHRRVAEKKLGRDLNPGEVVDHINKDKQDNRPHNLVVLKKEVHDRVHQSEYHERNACFKCGRTSHWAEDCYASTKRNGDYLDEESDSDSYDDSHGSGWYGGYDSFSDFDSD